MKSVTKVDCPTCGAPVEWTRLATWRPFCSERCKMMDLGAWANAEHAIPGNPPSEDEGGEPWQTTDNPGRE